MGIDTHILMNHELDTDGFLGNIDRILLPALDVLDNDRAFWTKHGRYARALPDGHADFRWRLESTWYDDTRIDEYEGPWGVNLDIGRHLARVSPVMRWGTFIDNAVSQAAVIAMARAIGGCIGARTFVYFPDSTYAPACANDVFCTGGTMDSLLAKLQTHCGPPAQTIGAINTFLSDAEMLRFDPDWDGDDDARIGNSDGYWVESLLK